MTSGWLCAVVPIGVVIFILLQIPICYGVHTLCKKYRKQPVSRLGCPTVLHSHHSLTLLLRSEQA